MDDWRNIDIDALDPENTITAEDLAPEVSQVSPEEVQSKVTNIRTLISKGSYGDAVLYATEEPPYGADDASKTLFLNSVIDIFSATKQTEIPEIVQSLSIEQQNALVKFLYKGMSLKKGQQQGGVLLSWFDKTVEVTGMGPVVRYLSDRRTI